MHSQNTERLIVKKRQFIDKTVGKENRCSQL